MFKDLNHLCVVLVFRILMGILNKKKSTGRLLEIIAASYTQQLTTAAKFCSFFQLIDLSSPLITLSPDVNKENLDSPLLKF